MTRSWDWLASVRGWTSPLRKLSSTRISEAVKLAPYVNVTEWWLSPNISLMEAPEVILGDMALEEDREGPCIRLVYPSSNVHDLHNSAGEEVTPTTTVDTVDKVNFTPYLRQLQQIVLYETKSVNACGGLGDFNGVIHLKHFVDYKPDSRWQVIDPPRIRKPKENKRVRVLYFKRDYFALPIKITASWCFTPNGRSLGIIRYVLGCLTDTETSVVMETIVRCWGISLFIIQVWPLIVRFPPYCYNFFFHDSGFTLSGAMWLHLASTFSKWTGPSPGNLSSPRRHPHTPKGKLSTSWTWSTVEITPKSARRSVLGWQRNSRLLVLQVQICVNRTWVNFFKAVKITVDLYFTS